MIRTLACLALAVPAIAQAGTFGLLDRAALQGDPETFTVNGVGAPSVAVDTLRDELVMAFESQIAPADDRCRAGYFAVGLARSVDGRTWDVDPTPMLEPGPDFACGARAPALLVDTDSTGLLLADALQGAYDCVLDSPGECPVSPGIARIDLSDGRPVSPPTVVIPGGSDATLVRVGELFDVVFVDGGDLMHATSEDGDTWTITGPALAAGVSPWNEDGLGSPSLVCRPGGDFPYTLYYTGTGSNDDGPTWGWASGIADDLSSMVFVDPSSPYHLRSRALFDSVAVAASADGETLAWVELRAAEGPCIALIGTSGAAGLTPSDLEPRACD